MVLSLMQIDQGIDALLANASELLDDAARLLAAKAHPRACALAQLGNEELAKVILLHATAIRILADKSIDWQLLDVRLRDHKTKRRLGFVNNVLFLQGLHGYRAGEDPMTTALLTKSSDVADSGNRQKNSALYVTYRKGVFVCPGEAITLEDASSSVLRLRMALGSARDDRGRFPHYSAQKVGSLRNVRPFSELQPHEIDTQLWRAAFLLEVEQAICAPTR